MVSTFSMTEPQAGADPKEFVCHATRDGDEWVIEGEKWFSSNARYASFLIVMVVTDPDAKPHERMSMLIVPAETPGIEIIRNVATMNERDDLDEGTEGYIRYNQVRVPLDAMLGAPGEGFKVAQSRLGGGRVHQPAVAKGLRRGYQPAPGLFPTEHIPPRRAAARDRYAAVLAEYGL